VRAGRRRYECLWPLALLVPALAHADYKGSYADGLKAAEDGKWARVRETMQEALTDNPQPAQRVRLYGQRFEAYVPQFYLGLAAWKLGDCTTAMAQWQNPAARQIVGGLPELRAEQDKGEAACKTQLAQQTPARPAEPARPEPARPEPTKPEPARPEPPRPEPPKPAPGKPESAKPAPAPVEPRPEPPVAAPPATARVSAPLLDAFRNYLAGRYAQAAMINVDVFSERERPQALLVRAAARYLQGELAGDAAQLDAARADARALRALAPALKPDPVLFSPRFRSFVDGAH